ncbi:MULTISPECIES: Nif3-like dinuclear metal center hexameric protein [Psychrilyobacter]|uniref:GTP cyclohydrolase 1 type 2 homolog n=1 Tax=Psychrilyobacter piezotolerans TaxID=2293438 RepID=A0ABX9KH32_9FUSO|nr:MULTISPECIES: Nif3-like dinuclear metal center hexameric protein [Psychrilyobacter]MCS5420362.1 Nif3-like dinuclear metal center hexameric protein [Psychrilyobacter sp. S5]NDI78056.1 Nif3-like dinuclear metal center hexameric protein [Psychrilyobacter piezotolerans]RDE61647.1 Nif3-like dinuclear metal center hexameric protein [Psychrilyobacter sp. S5]REI41039.1 Nif3-like dinuclear metal center hexameric protein [Psychrilyobacter piezotolerans]
MKIKTLIKRLEKKFPKNIAESWDNIGLLVGDDNREVTKIQISLDATEEVIDHAIEAGANLIITHHPIIFSGIKNVTSKNIMGRKLLKLIENKIAVYSMHTNLDSAENGLNQYICEKLGVKTSKILDEKYMEMYLLSVYIKAEFEERLESKVEEFGLEYNGYKNVYYTSDSVESFEKIEEKTEKKEKFRNKNKKISILGEKGKLSNLLNEIKKIHPYDEVAYEMIKTENKISLGGLGRIYSLSEGMELGSYLEVVKDKLSLNNVRVVGELDKKIKKIAVVNGGGASFLSRLEKIGVDLFITGDIKYHEALDAREMGISIFDIGHYESEYFFTDIIERHCDDLAVEIYNDRPVFKSL